MSQKSFKVLKEIPVSQPNIGSHSCLNFVYIIVYSLKEFPPAHVSVISTLKLLQHRNPSWYKTLLCNESHMRLAIAGSRSVIHPLIPDNQEIGAFIRIFFFNFVKTKFFNFFFVIFIFSIRKTKNCFEIICEI